MRRARIKYANFLFVALGFGMFVPIDGEERIFVNRSVNIIRLDPCSVSRGGT